MATPNSTQSTQAWLDANLDSSLFAARQLVAVMDDEHTALRDSDNEQLQTALTAKSRHVAELQQLQEKRERHFDLTGIPVGPQQLDIALEQMDATVELREKWDALVNVATDLKERNQTNGAIVQMRTRMIESGLKILRGSTADQTIYMSEGKTTSSLSQRTLAQA